MDTVPVAVVFTATPSCFQERDCFSGTASVGRIRWPPHNRGLSPVAGLPGPPLRPDATGSHHTRNGRAPGPRSPKTFAYQRATGLPTRRGPPESPGSDRRRHDGTPNSVPPLASHSHESGRAVTYQVTNSSAGK